MKRLNVLIRNATLALIATLAMTVAAFATVPPTPAAFAVSASYSPNTATFYMGWSYDNLSLADNFKVYLATGQTDNLANFTNIASVTASPDSNGGPHRYYATITHQLDPGYYTLYLTAYSAANGESGHSNFDIIHLTVPPPTITFTSQPIITGSVNNLYSYTAAATCSDGSAVKYYLAYPQYGMTIDSITGVINWTPTAAGVYGVNVVAYKATDPNIIQEQTFFLTIYHCANPSTITGVVDFQDGSPVMNGEVSVYNRAAQLINYATIDSTGFRLTLDEGVYYLNFQGNSFVSEWWQNKSEFEYADSIDVICGQSIAITVAVTAHGPSDNMHVVFISQPICRGVVDTLYNYQAHAVVSNGGIIDTTQTLIYSLLNGPSGMTINASTGLVSWTPTVGGEYSVSIRAILQSDTTKGENQKWIINVNNCANPALLTGIAVDQNDSLVREGAVYFYTSLPDTNGNVEPIASSMINNGHFQVNLDGGTYYIFFTGDNISSEWWENAATSSAATPFVLTCGEVDTINVTLNVLPQEEYYTISGHVYSESDSSLVNHGKVIFFAFDANGNSADAYMAGINNGEYNIFVSNRYTYIGYAQPSDNGAATLLGVYYGQTTDPTLATVLTFTGDSTGINFYLPARPTYSNSISGTIVNGDSNAVSNLQVVAFLVETDAHNADWLYYGRSVQVGSDTTNDNTFTMSNLIPGSYVLYVFKYDRSIIPGYYRLNDFTAFNWREATYVTVPESGDAGSYTIKVRLFSQGQGGGRINGHCHHGGHGRIGVGSEVASDTPIMGANVYIVNNSSKVVSFAITDSKGAYSLSSFGEGSYTLIADRVGYQNTSSTITVTSSTLQVTQDADMSSITSNVINNTTTNSSVVAYPNPATAQVTILYPAEAGSLSYSVFGIYGETISTVNTTVGSGTATLTIDVSGLSTGAYFVRLQNGDAISMIPISVVR